MAKAPPSQRTQTSSNARGKSTKVAASATISSTLGFYQDDFSKTLFPLRTNREIIERGEVEVKAYIAKCLDEGQEEFSFLSQHKVYADKPGLHLRRTIKLDPVAEYYIYDIVFRNRSRFRKPHTQTGSHYGYRFEGGMPISPSAAYKGFKGALADYSNRYTYYMGFDVASYFNSIYQHDLVNWFTELGVDNQDSRGFGQLTREINSGRSIDCLPQGLYPTKMVGNDFLRFIDNNHGLLCEQLIRFMDDVYIFSTNKDDVAHDFLLIQKLLGDKGLSVNPRKTTWDASAHTVIDREIDDIRRKLLDRRRVLITTGYEESGDDIVEIHLSRQPLTKRELEYIDIILNRSEIEEEDAELLLTIMRDHTSKVERRLPYLISKYPNLIKSVHGFCAHVSDKEQIGQFILDVLQGSSVITEFQLFWFAVMLEDYLMATSKASMIISALFSHKSATSITKAKILKVPDSRFGLPELRNQFLRSGQSDWLAWASAVGSRSLKATSRNHTLQYFGKSSQLNRLIAAIITK